MFLDASLYGSGVHRYNFGSRNLPSLYDRSPRVEIQIALVMIFRLLLPQAAGPAVRCFPHDSRGNSEFRAALVVPLSQFNRESVKSNPMLHIEKGLDVLTRSLCTSLASKANPFSEFPLRSNTTIDSIVGQIQSKGGAFAVLR